MTTQARTYTASGKFVYQIGNSRVVVDGRTHIFQVKKGGEWRNGRNSYCAETMRKVKEALAN